MSCKARQAAGTEQWVRWPTTSSVPTVVSGRCGARIYVLQHHQMSGKLQPEAAFRNLQVLGCRKPGGLWGNLATRATMIFRKILYRQRISVGISNRRFPARDRHKISEFCFISGNVSSWSLAVFELAEPASVTRSTFDLMLAARCANTHAWTWMTWFWWAVPHRGQEFHTPVLVATGDGRLPPNILSKTFSFSCKAYHLNDLRPAELGLHLRLSFCCYHALSSPSRTWPCRCCASPSSEPFSKWQPLH